MLFVVRVIHIFTLALVVFSHSVLETSIHEGVRSTRGVLGQRSGGVEVPLVVSQFAVLTEYVVVGRQEHLRCLQVLQILLLLLLLCFGFKLLELTFSISTYVTVGLRHSLLVAVIGLGLRLPKAGVVV